MKTRSLLRRVLGSFYIKYLSHPDFSPSGKSFPKRHCALSIQISSLNIMSHIYPFICGLQNYEPSFESVRWLMQIKSGVNERFASDAVSHITISAVQCTPEISDRWYDIQDLPNNRNANSSSSSKLVKFCECRLKLAAFLLRFEGGGAISSSSDGRSGR